MQTSSASMLIESWVKFLHLQTFYYLLRETVVWNSLKKKKLQKLGTST